MILSNKELLSKIKDKVSVEFGYDDWHQIDCLEIEEGEKAIIQLSIMNIVCERYATEKAKASCEATLKKASENGKVTREVQSESDNKIKGESEKFWTLFLRDSTLFLLKDGVEYKVSNPEFIFKDPDKKRDKTDLYIAYKIVDGTEWPGGVEIECTHGCKTGADCDEIRGCNLVARLLPKEEKLSYWQYQQFAEAAITQLKDKNEVLESENKLLREHCEEQAKVIINLSAAPKKGEPPF